MASLFHPVKCVSWSDLLESFCFALLLSNLCANLGTGFSIVFRSEHCFALSQLVHLGQLQGPEVHPTHV